MRESAGAFLKGRYPYIIEKNMERFVLVARPHGNIRQNLWSLKREAFDWNRDDAPMALPEGFICGWFALSEPSAGDFPWHLFSERAQQALGRHADGICSALPDTFHFSTVIREDGLAILNLDDEFDLPGLNTALELFAREASLRLIEPPATLSGVKSNGICLGSGELASAPAPLSFKKYELVLYLAELPETPLGGFQFRTVARIHRKVKVRPLIEGNMAIGED